MAKINTTVSDWRNPLCHIGPYCRANEFLHEQKTDNYISPLNERGGMNKRELLLRSHNKLSLKSSRITLVISQLSQDVEEHLKIIASQSEKIRNICWPFLLWLLSVSPFVSLISTYPSV